MQGIHTHIPETNHVPRGYIVAAILSLLFLVPLFLVPALALLFFYVSTFQSMCAVPNMAVFCSSLTSWFPGISLTYFLNDLEMVPVAPIITGITLVFTFHMRCISIARSLYFKIFSASFLITFLSPGIATSINMHVLFSLSRIIMSGLLLGIVLSVCTCWLLLLLLLCAARHCSRGTGVFRLKNLVRRHMVELPGRGIGQSEALYLHKKM